MATIADPIDIPAALHDAFRMDGRFILDAETGAPIAATCRRCGEPTLYEDLTKHRRMKYKADAVCHSCHVAQVQERHDELRQRDWLDMLLDALHIRRDGVKTCPRCFDELPLSAFGHAAREVDGTTYECLACAAARKQVSK